MPLRLQPTILEIEFLEDLLKYQIAYGNNGEQIKDANKKNYNENKNEITFKPVILLKSVTYNMTEKTSNNEGLMITHTEVTTKLSRAKLELCDIFTSQNRGLMFYHKDLLKLKQNSRIKLAAVSIAFNIYYLHSVNSKKKQGNKVVYNISTILGWIGVYEGKYLNFFEKGQKRGVSFFVEKLNTYFKSHSELEKLSIGVICTYGDQARRVKELLKSEKVKTDAFKTDVEKMIVSTVDDFQGDERDIILISWAYANNSFPQSLIFLQKPNLFNVAITRARYQMINFISKNPRELPEGILRSYLGFVEEYENRFALANSDDFDENIYKNSFEKEVAQAFRDLGHEVTCGVDIAGLSADLLVDNKFVIECDGVEDKTPLKVSNMKKQAIIERSGLKVYRISKREWSYSSKACINRILSL